LITLTAGKAEDDSVAVMVVADTLAVQHDDSVITLSHGFVIRGSERLFIGDRPIHDYELETVSGKVRLHSLPSSPTTLIIHYQTLASTIQTVYKPPIDSLPRLEEIAQKPALPIKAPQLPQFSSGDLPLVTDGSLFRGISLSPASGASLTGGLNFSLQGKITEDMTIAGSLSDQNSPIQPEGNTQALEEIDKVYLEVKHPFADITAGDIDMDISAGNFLTMSRRLQGLKVKMGGDDSKIMTTIGTSSAKFHRIELMGEDQNQGPYLLYSDNGTRGIIVMAGSEKVWIDGKRLERGDNNDYTVDYSQGEITFTPRRVIESSSRIYVEYEYSDFVYTRQMSAVSAVNLFSDGKSRASVNWVREGDDLDSRLAIAAGQDSHNLLELSGDDGIMRSTAVIDSVGHYIREPATDADPDSVFIYIYNDEKLENEVTYRVSFHNMGPAGMYARRVDSEGVVFYEYVPQSEREEISDLYVPWRPVASPELHQVATLDTKIYLSDSTIVSGELASSVLDRNLYSSLDDNDNSGYAGQMSLSHSQDLPGNWGDLKLSGLIQRRGEEFASLQRDERVEFSREWNLDKATQSYAQTDGLGRNLTSFQMGHRLGKVLNSTVSYGVYDDLFQKAHRWHGSASISSPFIPQLSVSFTQADRVVNAGTAFKIVNPFQPGRSSWRRQRMTARFLPGEIHPYLRYDSEASTAEFQFSEAEAGVALGGKLFRGDVGLVRRDDVAHATSGEWQWESTGWLGHLDMRARLPSGYRFNLVLRQRLKSFADNRDDLNYGLARGSFGYNPRRSVVSGKLDFKLEQSLFEEKVAVYDLVGEGRGDYRYDSDYAAYFLDTNGNFRLLHLPSGKKTPSTHLATGVRFAFDFRRSDRLRLRPFTWRFLGSSDIQSSDSRFAYMVGPSMSASGLHRARIILRQDLNYAPREKRRRVRLTSNYRTEVVGKSFQESFERVSLSHALSAEEPLLNSITGVVNVDRHDKVLNSAITSRNRNARGWNLDTGLRWRSTEVLELGGDIYLGSDSGSNSFEDFTVFLRGAGMHALFFRKAGGRIEGSADYFRVTSAEQLSASLPPEAVRGMQVGNNLRSSVTALLFFREGISASANFNYIANQIHDGLLTVTGEIRASF